MLDLFGEGRVWSWHNFYCMCEQCCKDKAIAQALAWEGSYYSGYTWKAKQAESRDAEGWPYISGRSDLPSGTLWWFDDERIGERSSQINPSNTELDERGSKVNSPRSKIGERSSKINSRNLIVVEPSSQDVSPRSRIGERSSKINSRMIGEPCSHVNQGNYSGGEHRSQAILLDSSGNKVRPCEVPTIVLDDGSVANEHIPADRLNLSKVGDDIGFLSQRSFGEGPAVARDLGRIPPFTSRSLPCIDERMIRRFGGLENMEGKWIRNESIWYTTPFHDYIPDSARALPGYSNEAIPSPLDANGEIRMDLVTENGRLLHECGYNMRTFLTKRNHASALPAVNFNVRGLNQHFKHHISFEAVGRMVTCGLTLHPSPALEMSTDRRNIMNHGGAVKYRQEILKNLAKSVKKGKAVLFPDEILDRVSGCWLNPITAVPKPTVPVTHRVIFDPTFSVGDIPLNHRVDMVFELQPQFGQCLKRLCIKLNDMRHHYPLARIMLFSGDVSDAFNLLSLLPESMPAICYRPEDHKGVTAMSLSPGFGLRVTPAAFCTVMELIPDLFNSLPYGHHSEREPCFLDVVWERREKRKESGRPRKAAGHSLYPKLTDRSLDCYVDDLIGMEVDLGDRIKRALRSLVWCFCQVFSDVGIEESEWRPSCLNLAKTLIGGLAATRSEQLGVIIDTHHSTLAAPLRKIDKLKDLLLEIRRANFTMSMSDLLTLIGYLQHVRLMSSFGDYFLHYLYFDLDGCLIDNRNVLKLGYYSIEALRYWEDWSKNPDPRLIKSIVPKFENVVCFVDASFTGLGGVIHHKGRSWMFSVELPEDIKRLCRNHENVPEDHVLFIHDLELAVVVLTMFILQSVLSEKEFRDAVILIKTDNTSALAWCNKSGATRGRPMALTRLLCVARNGRAMPQLNFRTEHIAGVLNVVADILSRYYGKNDDKIFSDNLKDNDGHCIPKLPRNSPSALESHLKSHYKDFHSQVPLERAVWVTPHSDLLLPIYSLLRMSMPKPQSRTLNAPGKRRLMIDGHKCCVVSQQRYAQTLASRGPGN